MRHAFLAMMLVMVIGAKAGADEVATVKNIVPSKALQTVLESRMVNGGQHVKVVWETTQYNNLKASLRESVEKLRLSDPKVMAPIETRLTLLSLCQLVHVYDTEEGTFFQYEFPFVDGDHHKEIELGLLQRGPNNTATVYASALHYHPGRFVPYVLFLPERLTIEDLDQAFLFTTAEKEFLLSAITRQQQWDRIAPWIPVAVVGSLLLMSLVRLRHRRTIAPPTRRDEEKPPPPPLVDPLLGVLLEKAGTGLEEALLLTMWEMERNDSARSALERIATEIVGEGINLWVSPPTTVITAQELIQRTETHTDAVRKVIERRKDAAWSADEVMRRLPAVEVKLNQIIGILQPVAEATEVYYGRWSSSVKELWARVRGHIHSLSSRPRLSALRRIEADLERCGQQASMVAEEYRRKLAILDRAREILEGIDRDIKHLPLSLTLTLTQRVSLKAIGTSCSQALSSIESGRAFDAAEEPFLHDVQDLRTRLETVCAPEPIEEEAHAELSQRVRNLLPDIQGLIPTGRQAAMNDDDRACASGLARRAKQLLRELQSNAHTDPSSLPKRVEGLEGDITAERALREVAHNLRRLLNGTRAEGGWHKSLVALIQAVRQRRLAVTAEPNSQPLPEIEGLQAQARRMAEEHRVAVQKAASGRLRVQREVLPYLQELRAAMNISDRTGQHRVDVFKVEAQRLLTDLDGALLNYELAMVAKENVDQLLSRIDAFTDQRGREALTRRPVREDVVLRLSPAWTRRTT